MEKQEHYQHIIDILQSSPQAAAPDDFTHQVMVRLPEIDHGFLPSLKHLIFNPSRAALRSCWDQMLSVSDLKECSLCFFITGFFYLIMGIILMAGLKAIGANIFTMDWIRLQPYFTIIAAIWLIALGILMILDGSASMKIAKYSMLFYIFFTLFNGVLMWPSLRIPHAGVFVIGFVVISAIMGIMLAIAVQHLELRMES